jgi:hypothetical protein
MEGEENQAESRAMGEWSTIGVGNSIQPPNFLKRHPLYSMSRCGYNGKKGIHNRGVFAAHFVIRATPFKSYCEARLYKTQLHNRRKHNGNYSPDIRKREEGKKKIIQNTRNIPHLCLNAMVAKKYCEKFWDRWLEGVGKKTLGTRDHRTLEAITFAPT